MADDTIRTYQLPDGSTASEVKVDTQAGRVEGVRKLPSGRQVRFTASLDTWSSLTESKGP